MVWCVSPPALPVAPPPLTPLVCLLVYVLPVGDKRLPLRKRIGPPRGLKPDLDRTDLVQVVRLQAIKKGKRHKAAERRRLKRADERRKRNLAKRADEQESSSEEEVQSDDDAEVRVQSRGAKAKGTPPHPLAHRSKPSWHNAAAESDQQPSRR